MSEKTRSFLAKVSPGWGVILLVAIAISFLAAGPHVYTTYIKAYLPLITPLLLSIVSSLIREEKGSLRTYAIDLSLGVVSFDVWAITSVMTNSDKVAQLTPSRVLDAADVTLCLIVGLVLIAWCSFITHGQSSATEKTAKLRELSAIIFAILCFLIPTKIASAVQPKEGQVKQTPEFRALVPYVDNSLVTKIGAGNWGDRFLCTEVHIKSDSPEDARMQAIKVLRESRAPLPVYGGDYRSIDLREENVSVEGAGSLR